MTYIRLHPQPSIFEQTYILQIQFLRRGTSGHIRIILKSNRPLDRRDNNKVLYQFPQQQLPAPSSDF
jgi:hypothetical protein